MPVSTTVALLRGVNVGGRNKVPMKALRTAMAAAGFRAVDTLLASGNLLFGPHPEDPATVLSRLIEAHFGCTIDVVLRTGPELRAVAAEVPFPVDAIDPKWIHVGFCAPVPPAEVAAALDPHRSPPDRFVVRGGTIYVHYPEGSARSKLTAPWFDRQLGCTTTFRNWRTLGRILERVHVRDAGG